MSENKIDAGSKPGETLSFISKELRPGSSGTDDCPVISPDAPSHEIRRRAGEVLGHHLRTMLGAESAESAPLTPAHICVRSDTVTFAEVEGEAVLLDLESGRYYSLNLPGSAIWVMFTGEHDLGAIHRSLCQRFEVDGDAAWQDLVALVQNLCGEKLARVEAPSNVAL